jgi:hypothetical protein
LQQKSKILSSFGAESIKAEARAEKTENGKRKMENEGSVSIFRFPFSVFSARASAF